MTTYAHPTCLPASHMQDPDEVMEFVDKNVPSDDGIRLTRGDGELANALMDAAIESVFAAAGEKVAAGQFVLAHVVERDYRVIVDPSGAQDIVPDGLRAFAGELRFDAGVTFVDGYCLGEPCDIIAVSLD